jgi:hypothetical protein
MPRSRIHNGHINPWNKSKHNPKRKHNSRGKGLSQCAEPLADNMQGLVGQSRSGRWTVRGVGEDGSYYGIEPPVSHLGKMDSP